MRGFPGTSSPFRVVCHVMRVFIACGVLLGAFAATASHVSADSPRTVECGGVRLTYGTSVGSAGPNVHKQYASGIMAMAAVTLEDLHARAWIIWDETAHPWLALVKQSPEDLSGSGFSRRRRIFRAQEVKSAGHTSRHVYLRSTASPIAPTRCPTAHRRCELRRCRDR
jgi:hypothetical protein